MAGLRQRWRLGEGAHLAASHVASALAAREAVAPLSYRDVALAVDTLEVRGAASEEQPAQLFRVFIVEVVSWRRFALSQRYQRPQCWRSEVLPVYDERLGTVALRLQGF